MTTLKSQNWEHGWYKIEKNYYRVVFRASTGPDKHVDIALDDITIEECPRKRKPLKSLHFQYIRKQPIENLRCVTVPAAYGKNNLSK